MTELSYVELHNPIFIGGTNLGSKLDIDKRRNLSLHFDDDKKRLKVTLTKPEGNFVGHVPEANCSMWIEKKEEKKEAPQEKPKTQAKVSAQVETPQSHVFAGPGAGRTK